MSPSRTPPSLHDDEVLEDPARIREAVAAGADINRRNSDGRTPLIEAMKRRHFESVRELLHLGADPGVVDEFGLNAVHYIANANAWDLVEDLPSGCPALNATNSFGTTPLHLAGRTKAKRTLVALLVAGADVHARDKMGETVRDAAVRMGREDVVWLLDRASARQDINETLTEVADELTGPGL